MRFRSGNPRAAFRRLPPELRGPALCALVEDSNPAPAWVWAELIEIASLPDRSVSLREARLRAMVGAPAFSPKGLRDRAIDLLAARWKCLSTLEKDAAIAVVGGGLGAAAIRLAWASDPTSDSGSVRALGRALGEPFLTRVLGLRCVRGDSAADEELCSEVDVAIGPDGRLQGSPADPVRCAELLEGVAWAIDRATGTTDLRVSRGFAWSAWALLEVCRESNEARAVLVKAAGSTDSSVGRAMGGVLRWDRDPLIRRAAWRWAPVEAIGAAAIDRLSRSASLAEHEAILRLGHLAARPLRRARLAMIAVPVEPASGVVRPGGVLPSLEQIGQLSTGARRQIVRVVFATNAEPAARSAAIEPLLTDEDELVRLSVAACADRSEARDLCFDLSRRVARVAVHRWSRCGVAPARRRSPPAEIGRVLSALSSSAHDSVRRAASEDLRGLELFDHRCPVSRLAARRAAREDPSGFVGAVRERLRTASRAASALLTAEAIGLVGAVEEDLLRLAAACVAGRDEPENNRLLAVIASCLRSTRSTEAARVLAELVNAPDHRVRANAVDSLVLGPAGMENPAGTLDRLVELKSDPAHRVRGAAVRGLSCLATRAPRVGLDATEALRGMLVDDREEHRIAGMWAAGRAIGSFEDSAFRAWVVERAREFVVAGESRVGLRLASQSRALLARAGVVDLRAEP